MKLLINALKRGHFTPKEIDDAIDTRIRLIASTFMGANKNQELYSLQQDFLLAIEDNNPKEANRFFKLILKEKKQLAPAQKKETVRE